MWNKCFGRRKRTTIFCTGCWGLAKTPRGRSAALSGELGGRGTFRGTARGSVATPPVPAQCVRRPGRGGRTNGAFSRLPWSKVPQIKTLGQLAIRAIIYKKKVPFFYFLLQKSTSIFFLELLERSTKTLRPSFFGPHPLANGEGGSPSSPPLTPAPHSLY